MRQRAMGGLFHIDDFTANEEAKSAVFWGAGGRRAIRDKFHGVQNYAIEAPEGSKYDSSVSERIAKCNIAPHFYADGVRSPRLRFRGCEGQRSPVATVKS